MQRTPAERVKAKEANSNSTFEIPCSDAKIRPPSTSFAISPPLKNKDKRRSGTGSEETGWSGEAAALGTRAKSILNEARNLKTELKTGAFTVIDSLVSLVRKIEMVHKHKKGPSISDGTALEEIRETMRSMAERQSCCREADDSLARTVMACSGKLASLAQDFAAHTKHCEDLNRGFALQAGEILDGLKAKDADDERVRVKLIEHAREGIKEAMKEGWRDGLTEGIKDGLKDCLNVAIRSKMDECLQEARAGVNATLTGKTYAETAATSRPVRALGAGCSVIVSASKENATSSDVVGEVAKALKATQNGLQIDRLRKVRDGKVVLTCSTQEELDKATNKLKSANSLQVEPAKNKDPLVVLKNVLAYNDRAAIVSALRSQNKHIMEGLTAADTVVEERFRRRARNQLECHVILRVSPKLWARMIEVGYVYIDIQRVIVEDQTPLIQCSRCLAYGHGRKICKAEADLCAHCGGPHLRADCPKRAAGEVPVCVNCKHTNSKYDTGHAAYSLECPVRKKWDAIARTSIAYC